MTHRPSRLVALNLVATALFGSALCRAEPEPAAMSPARLLFQEGRELASAGNYREACPKFEQSLALEVGIGTQFNLADCWEHVGRTASARALFLGAAALAKAAGQPEREQVLRERALSLEPRLSRLQLVVAANDEALVVQRNGLPLETEAYAAPSVVDPGRYEIVASAPGKQSFRTSVTVSAGTSLVTLEIPALLAVEPNPAPSPVEPSAEPETKVLGPVDSEPPPALPAELRRRGFNWTSVTLGAVGVGGVAFGSLMALRFSSKNDDAKTICPSSHGCTTAEIERHDRLVDDAKSARTWTFVGFAAGGAALAAATVVFFSPSTESSTGAGSWLATPVFGARELGASVSGRF